jgi:methylthioxylose transferase
MSTTRAAAPRPPIVLARNVRMRAAWVTAAWVGVVGGVSAWGVVVTGAHPEMHLNAPPLFGRFNLDLSVRAVPAILLGLIGATYWARATGTLRWNSLLATAVASGAAWSLALSFAGGELSWYEPLLGRHDYLVEAARIESLREWLASFTDRLSQMPVHVQGHPPGMVIVLYALQRIGLGGAPWAAAVIIGVAASGIAAVLVGLRRMVDEVAARAVAPFLVFAPVAIWIVTSADALFAGVAAWAVALGLLVVTSSKPRAPVAALAGGITFGIALLLSYGVALLALVVVAAAWRRSRLSVLVPYALGSAIPLAAAAIFGFWWPAGLLATRSAYLAGVAADRPYWFFLATNLAAFALVLGPATTTAIIKLRYSRVWWVIGPALAAVAIAAISGLSKGEVERIWLPFALWILPATCAISAGSRARWLAAQVVTALAVEVVVVTPW